MPCRKCRHCRHRGLRHPCIQRWWCKARRKCALLVRRLGLCCSPCLLDMRRNYLIRKMGHPGDNPYLSHTLRSRNPAYKQIDSGRRPNCTLWNCYQARCHWKNCFRMQPPLSRPCTTTQRCTSKCRAFDADSLGPPRNGISRFVQCRSSQKLAHLIGKRRILPANWKERAIICLEFHGGGHFLPATTTKVQRFRFSGFSG